MVDIKPVRRSRLGYWMGVLLAYVTVWPMILLLRMCGRWPAQFSKAMDRTAGRFGDYQPGAHDVLVCSYYKSGTNWMLQIAVQIAHRGRATFDHIHDLVAWPEIPARHEVAVPISDESPWRSAPTGLRVIKTHLPLGKVPYTTQARYIGLVRDPKDVFVSGYHFTRDTVLGPLMPSKEAWLGMYLSPHTLCGSWAVHLDSYWRARHRDNVCFLTYEQMQRDPRAAVCKVAQFMRIELTDEELEAVVRQSAFSHMKTIGHKFDPRGLVPPWIMPDGSMLRHGKSGSSEELLSPLEQQRIDAYWSGELARLGSDFDYDEAFRRTMLPTTAENSPTVAA